MKDKKSYIQFIIIASLGIINISLLFSLKSLSERKSIRDIRQEELRMMKQTQKELQERFNQTQTNEFVEQEARNKLNMAKEGEIVILMNKTSDKPSTTDGKSFSILQQWWRLFF